MYTTSTIVHFQLGESLYTTTYVHYCTLPFFLIHYPQRAEHTRRPSVKVDDLWIETSEAEKRTLHITFNSKKEGKKAGTERSSKVVSLIDAFGDLILPPRPFRSLYWGLIVRASLCSRVRCVFRKCRQLFTTDWTRNSLARMGGITPR